MERFIVVYDDFALALFNVHYVYSEECLLDELWSKANRDTFGRKVRGIYRVPRSEIAATNLPS
jgi:hypothetical protein